jgi:hypothetical protein
MVKKKMFGNKIHALLCWTILLSQSISACQATLEKPQTQISATESQPTITIASEIPDPSLTPTPLTESPLPTKTDPVRPALTPSPTPIGPQVILNGGFDNGLQDWDQPYGDLKHSTAEYHTGSAAAGLITSSPTGFLDYHGNMGQCIELSPFLSGWPVFEGQRYLTLEAYFRTGAEITNVSLNGIFLTEPECRTGQAGFFELPTLDGDQPWTRIAGTIPIPTDAVSFHVFVDAYGSTASAIVQIDDLRAYASEPTGN